MPQPYQLLPFHHFESGAGYFRPRQQLPEHVTEDDPAISVMTDLSQVTAYTTELSTPANKALEMMVKRGVRMLLVRDADGQVVGLLTSRDIEGDKPKRILAKAGGAWEDLLVADIMTLKPKLEVLLMEDVAKACVGDIIATLRHVNRQHAMALDTDPRTGKPAVRGIFSLSQIGLQLGLDIDRSHRATTYSDLENAKTPK
ncbi:MAG: CBS domain-containing protein [Candidatus Competibacteraceae bacterium]|nr:CBS domain-containing protein [Candidatus Competibacteraceae bacterium]MBK7983912.1 CBS domain-containing protein [Candidatus Competibacteraceae bacterium]MBK8897546.1 CBS domain-containing protein [Candidatus Competibacteraceae bacterium]MBK8963698.1 CBS domain-containing protein [Candidatus Competibacteraceae bacterium]MBK9950588.1 CBS domain-containing protein [Candidatus Competibacteraceae bacterium]